MHRPTALAVSVVFVLVTAGCGGGGGGDGGGGDPDPVASRFACGDHVAANVVLLASDLVTTETCPGDGLFVDAGVTLDLGGLTLQGGGAGVGLQVGDGATVTNGTVTGFQTGAWVMADATVTLTHLALSNSSYNGLLVEGGLAAEALDVGGSGTAGIQVKTEKAVELVDAVVHDGGNMGVWVLRTHPDSGFVMRGLQTSVHDNSDDGIVLGHLVAQTGLVYARISDARVYGNHRGITVAQGGPVATPTYWTLLNNNIYGNRDAGISFGPSGQRFLDFAGTQGFAGNTVHRNAVTGTGCTAEAGAQQANAQIVVSGLVNGTDPDPGPDGPDPLSYPGDHACYWGPAAGENPIASQTACNELNDPANPAAIETKNHCVWTGTECRLAWDLGGAEPVTEGCGTSANRVFAYVNAAGQPPETQKGIVALYGARVRARANQWGVGGDTNGAYADGTSVIDSGDSCGTTSLCE